MHRYGGGGGGGGRCRRCGCGRCSLRALPRPSCTGINPATVRRSCWVSWRCWRAAASNTPELLSWKARNKPACGAPQAARIVARIILTEEPSLLGMRSSFSRSKTADFRQPQASGPLDSWFAACPGQPPPAACSPVLRCGLHRGRLGRSTCRSVTLPPPVSDGGSRSAVHG